MTIATITRERRMEEQRWRRLQQKSGLSSNGLSRIEMRKSEIRSSKHKTSTNVQERKLETRTRVSFISLFEDSNFVSDFGLRISNFLQRATDRRGYSETR
jgi:hypothetical protein